MRLSFESPLRKLLARTNGGTPLVTTYDYYDDDGTDLKLTGELQSVTYTGSTTPAVTYDYDRLGRQKVINDVVGERTFAYYATGELQSETIVAGANGLYSTTISRDYEADGTETVAGRYAGFHIGSDYDVDYVYEPKTTGTGRLMRINGPGLPDGDGGAFYGYTTNSDLVGSLTYKDASGTAVASATREYDGHRDLLKHVENKAGTGLSLVSKYDYSLGDGYDGAGRRTSVVYTGSAFDPEHHVDFGYNDRGELTAADRRQGTTPGQGNHLAAEQHAFEYEYDPIGNRESYQLDGGTATTYTTNDVNQYTATADPAEYLCYDADGNLVQDGKPTSNCNTADGTMTYVWNGENRLIEAFPTSPAANDKKVEFKYDYLGRRVEKVVWTYSDSAWSVESTQRFVYDGWNVVLVLDDDGDPQRKYTWGLDLSGTVHAAGGIGGLLAVEDAAAQGSPAYWYFYDGNGNVGQVIAADGQSTVAKYEYGPYGNLIASSGTYADANPFRFSTKWFDVETGLYYYGYRYYAPRLGRWLNRDPIGEEGGPNLHAFVGNRVADAIDRLGLWGRETHYTGTYDLAKEIGFSDRCAKVLAEWNQGVDDWTGASMFTWYHFNYDVHGRAFPCGRDCWFDKRWNTGVDKLNKAKKYYSWTETCVYDGLAHIGAALHHRQDSFAHSVKHQASTPFDHAPSVICLLWGDASGKIHPRCIDARMNNPNWSDPHLPDNAEHWAADYKATLADTKALLQAIWRIRSVQCHCKRE